MGAFIRESDICKIEINNAINNKIAHIALCIYIVQPFNNNYSSCIHIMHTQF